MSKNVTVTLTLAVPDDADPDSVGGWVFDLLCNQGEEADGIYESCDFYDTAVE